jgi:alpha-mannosidase
VIRAEMLRGPRYTSVKVVRDGQVTSMQYPPAGSYVFRYAISASSGDWIAAKAYRTGMDLNNPLLPVSVIDRISSKAMPPSQSLCMLGAGNLVISAIKKSDLDSAILLRAYEIEGSPAETTVEFLNQRLEFREVNLLEEDAGPPGQTLLKLGACTIKTLKFQPAK